MRVPIEWLKEYIDIEVSAEEIAKVLTNIGHEVEAIERFEDDTVLEVNITPNRPDCLSIFGIARELSAFFRKPLRFPEIYLTEEKADEIDFKIDILDPDLCNRYAGCIVKGVKIEPSPPWMARRLEKCGIRAINNIVDITNYVLLELGHPLHAFDLDTLKGKCIRVGTPQSVTGNQTSLITKTLDGIAREIPSSGLLIWDAEEPIAIAGIMGGLDTEVKDATENIFLESAYFNPLSILRTSKVLGLKTESSYRFEKGTDINMLEKALLRATFLMRRIAGGEVYGKLDVYPKLFAPKTVILRYRRVNSILGLNLSKDYVYDIIERLGFEIHGSDEYFTVTPPSFRVDISREIDLVEEIARIFGYDRIPSELPKAQIGFDDTRERVAIAKNNVKESIRTSCLRKGFNEVINFSFMGSQDLDMLKIAENDERRKLVKILNPLRIEDSYMRTTLIPSLIKNVEYNVAHGNRDLRLFEISKVFINKEKPIEGVPHKDSILPEERTHIAAIFYKEKTKTLYRDDIHEFYLMKGVIEAILENLKIDNHLFVRSSEGFLHPGQSADLFINDIKIGFVGTLAPFVYENLEIRAYRPRIVVFELNLDCIIQFSKKDIIYRQLSKYPYIERDTAIIVDSTLESSVLRDLINQHRSDLIEGFYIFDVYQGDNIPKGKKSIAFNLRYRASDRTLTDEDVDKIHNALITYILEKTGGQIRT
ncbi:MAG: phenylalanine--tRNA ligase subunit beta [Thermodesulfovibrionales bacterium]|nr:phenylalanine--tRNA ligase subunit beta [Thermodesulfovibrionales bacterium]